LLDGVVNPLLALVRTGVENDFEDVAFRQHPSLRDIKRALAGSSTETSRAVHAALSGSGSALFGIYGSSEAALEAQHRVQSLGHRALLTETLPRREYWQRMFA
jgi:4-diphosphocytidyl-2-C-methyl-D-erythritol kinase